MGGDIPPQAKLNPLLGQQNPLVQSLRQGESIYSADIENNKNWANSPLLRAIKAKGIISLPITTFAGAEAAILTFSKEPFPELGPEEIHLYELLSQQASYIIQSVKLLTETSQRLSKVNLLLDFSRKLDQLNPEAIIQTLLESAQQLIHTTQGVMVLLKDQVRNKIMPHVADGYRNSSAMLEITFSPHKGLIEKVFRNNNPLRLNSVSFAQDYMLEKDNLLSYREGTGGVLPISCLAVPIETRDNQMGVIILENFEQETAFSIQDQALLSSLAQQTALALENVQLIHTAEQRATQLEALTQATSTLTSSGLQRQDLIDSLLKQLAKIVPYDTGALWMHEAGQLIIHTARGFENNQDLIGITTQISESKLMYEMIRTGEPLVIPNIQADARFPAADQKGPNSWLGVPLLTKDQILGVIALEKRETGFYTPTHTQMLQTFGSQAAIAIENAGLYQESVDRGKELNQRTQRLAMLNQFSNKLSSSLNLEESFQITLEELSQLIPHSIVSGILWAEDGEAVLQSEMPQQSGLSLSPGDKLPQSPIFEHIKQSQGIFTTRNITNEEILAPLLPFFEERKTKSLLVLPIIVGDDLHGFLFIHSDHQYRFNGEEIELARITANQAAIAIRNAFLTMNLEKRVLERTQELKEEHDRAQTLLQVLQALSASLDLDEVLHHTLSLLNSALGADQSTILLIQPDKEYLYYRAALGYMESPPRGGRPSGLKKDEGLAGWAITHNQCDVVDDIIKDDRWVSTSTVAPDLHSAIVAPIAHGADILGAISLFHRQTGQFNKYQRDLVHATAKQIAVAINNTQLVAYIQEQTNELGQML
ncbi:MAG: GAF domain-containing protein, partial [Chloroflexota bacterium]|nr:GAF domain-containing protein [Chloroflexota bacterium]